MPSLWSDISVPIFEDVPFVGSQPLGAEELFNFQMIFPSGPDHVCNDDQLYLVVKPCQGFW